MNKYIPFANTIINNKKRILFKKRTSKKLYIKYKGNMVSYTMFKTIQTKMKGGNRGYNFLKQNEMVFRDFILKNISESQEIKDNDPDPNRSVLYITLENDYVNIKATLHLLIFDNTIKTIQKGRKEYIMKSVINNIEFLENIFRQLWLDNKDILHIFKGYIPKKHPENKESENLTEYDQLSYLADKNFGTVIIDYIIICKNYVINVTYKIESSKFIGDRTEMLMKLVTYDKLREPSVFNNFYGKAHTQVQWQKLESDNMRMEKSISILNPKPNEPDKISIASLTGDLLEHILKQSKVVYHFDNDNHYYSNDEVVDILKNTMLEAIPPAARRSPNPAKMSPSPARRSPSATRRSLSATRRSLSATRRSLSATRRSPSDARRSPSATRRSPSAGIS
jgi:hypothetical protein